MFYERFFKYILFQRLRRYSNKDKMERSIQILVTRLHQIWSKYGITYFCKYLKVALFATYSYLGGKPLSTTEPLGVSIKLAKGLPFVIPPFFRRRIRQNDIIMIHIIVTILNSYKGLQDDHIIEVGKVPSTITAPAWDAPAERMSEWNSIVRKSPISNVKWDIKRHDPLLQPTIFTAGPNGNISSLYHYEDCVSYQDTDQYEFLTSYIQETGYTGWSRRNWRYLKPHRVPRKGLSFTDAPHDSKFQILSRAFPEYKFYIDPDSHEITCSELPKGWERDKRLKKAFDAFMVASPRLGKLSIKLEAAGKVRIFAMLDSITQGALKPLHDMIFAWLKTLPSDATFNQEEVLSKFVELNQGRNFWCFDLSSATDNIPRQLYIPLLEVMIGPKAANLWSSLFDRPFLMPKAYWPDSYSPYWVTYSRGQPMGSYSSWAMLAMVHHMVVLLAQHRVDGSLTFPVGKYLVLGDDIVISDPLLANSYKAVCADFGIPIGLLKSFTDVSICNFANQVITNKLENISPISLKEIFQAKTLTSRLELNRRMQRRGYIGTKSSDLFRSFFSPETWLNETKFLNRGLYSSYGNKVVSLLTYPNGKTSTNVINTIKGLYPHSKTLAYPLQEMNLDWQKAILNLPGRPWEAWASKETLILTRLIHLLDTKVGKFFERGAISLQAAFDQYWAVNAEYNELLQLPSKKMFLTISHLMLPTTPHSRIKYILESWVYMLLTGGIYRPPECDSPALQLPVKLNAILEQALALRRYRSAYIRLGYDDEGNFTSNAFITDLVKFAYDLVPFFNPMVNEEWDRMSKVARIKSSGSMDTVSPLLRDIRRISSSIGYPSLVTQDRRILLRKNPPPFVKRKRHP